MAASPPPYVRPGWTGKPLVYSDGKVDAEWAECPSCLGMHAVSFMSCAGRRSPCPDRCGAVLGEIHCERPANHVDLEASAEHVAESSMMCVRWLVKPRG